MNLKQAHYVKTIAECGSITAAAKKLYVSQPSLSQMLRHIENELGIEIFDRSATPFRLTYAGEKYMEAADILLAASAQLESQIREIRHEKSGRLRLGISVSRGLQVLPLVIPVFAKKYPNVIVELSESGSATLESLLQEGKIDLALAAIESTSDNLDYRLIEKEKIGILAGKNAHIATKLENGSFAVLDDAKHDMFVNLCKGHSTRVVQDKLFRNHNFSPRILLETDTLEIGKRITLDADACMILPNIYIDDYVTQKGGAFFPFADYDHKRHFYACYRKDTFVPKYMRDFIQIVIDELDYRSSL